MLSNLPLAAIWANTLSKNLLDPKVSPKKRQVIKGTRGAIREMIRMS